MKHLSYRPLHGSGPLSAYWHDGPYGAATEADGGNGVGWFTPNGEVLGVEFDDVNEVRDTQSLAFGTMVVQVTMQAGKATVRVIKPRKRSRAA